MNMQIVAIVQESLCQISCWFRQQQEDECAKTAASAGVGRNMDAAAAAADDDDDDSSSRDTWTPVHVEPTYGPCNRCYPRNLKFSTRSGVGGASHVTMTTATPPPTPPEERDKFECLYLLVDTAISRIECERGQPMCN